MGMVSQLKKEHVEIIRSLESLKDLVGDESLQDKDLAEEFRELKELLVGHLGLEDQMYLRMKKSNEEEAKNIADKFSEEMLKISKIIMAFFDKWGHDKVSELRKNETFKKEFEGIFNAVKERVGVEEKILFPAYEKYYE